MHDGHTHNDHQEHDPKYFHLLTPILNVKDCRASIEYYVTKLGFDQRWEWGTPVTFACVSRGNIEIFLCEGGQGNPGTWMSIFMKDVDPLFEEYKQSGALIVDEPVNYPWGCREMLVGDLDGHRLRMTGEVKGAITDDYKTAALFKSPEP